MYSLLLAVIYLGFIGLGLPDSLLGSGWPAMQISLGVDSASAGYISMIITAGTIVSSLFADRLTKRFGSGVITAVSIGLTAGAILGFGLTNSYAVLCLLSIPYGLGAGAVDATLNNYVALHYAARHMSWLHCFWGVGTCVSPFIMSWALSVQHDWHAGYSLVGVCLVVICILVLSSLSLWKKGTGEADADDTKPLSISGALKIKGVKHVLICFFAYCSLEGVAMLWASSFLVGAHSLSKSDAAFFGSMFFIGITFGRFVSGLVTDRFGDKKMIRFGIALTLVGVMLIALSGTYMPLSLVGLVVTGLGCAPIYPSIIHATPENFGKQNSGAIIGIQMASAYLGTTIAPPIFGLLTKISFDLFPYFMFVFIVLMVVTNEGLNKLKAKKLIINIYKR